MLVNQVTKTYQLPPTVAKTIVKFAINFLLCYYLMIESHGGFPSKDKVCKLLSSLSSPSLRDSSILFNNTQQEHFN